jgi:hypothetical protein
MAFCQKRWIQQPMTMAADMPRYIPARHDTYCGDAEFTSYRWPSKGIHAHVFMVAHTKRPPSLEGNIPITLINWTLAKKA